MKVLIIEDEIPAAHRLTKLLQQQDDEIAIVHKTDSIETSVQYLNSAPSIDLIFMDIQLADGLSFDIFEQVTVKTPVIFTTAKLLVSDVSLKTSDLYTGNLNELPEVNEVDWVYFQYSQSSAIKHEIESKTHINDSWDRIVARDYVRTIAVVSPSGIESYLRGGWVSF